MCYAYEIVCFTRKFLNICFKKQMLNDFWKVGFLYKRKKVD